MLDLQFGYMLLKLVIALPFVILLIYLSLKYGGNKLQQVQSGRFVKILERIALTKENSIFVVKIGEKAYVITSTSKDIKILMELTKEQVKEIEASRKVYEYKDLKDFYEKSGVARIYKKLKSKNKEEDNNE